MSEETKEATQIEPQNEPVSKSQTIIQPESGTIVPMEVESAPIPQPVEVLEKTPIKPEITLEIEPIPRHLGASSHSGNARGDWPRVLILNFK